MSSVHKDYQKAESIVHHLLRLGSKVTDPIKRRRRKNVLKKRLKELRESINDASSSTFLHSSSAYSSYSQENSCMLFDETTPRRPLAEERADSLDELLSIGDSEFGDDNGVKTIDQNDLMVECFMGNDDGEAAFVIHFFDEDSTISQEIDRYLETRLFAATSLAWKCRRVNSRLAPMFSKILDLDPEQPTVVAIKDGIMITKQTELSSPVDRQLERWMKATENILYGEQEEMESSEDDFDNDAYCSDEDSSFDGNDENNDVDVGVPPGSVIMDDISFRNIKTSLRNLKRTGDSV